MNKTMNIINKRLISSLFCFQNQSFARHRNSFRNVVCVSNRQFTSTASSSPIKPESYDNKLRVLVSESNDAILNLATEEWLLRKADIGRQTLFLWQNDKSVIVGRNQNVWKECHVQELEDAGVQLVRRGSGGGAVYQDLGNSCFTFLSPMKDYDRDRNFKILIDALSLLGVDAMAKGRNDIVVDGQKISGSAYKYITDRALHHGTMLVDVDTAMLGKVLNPSKAKLQSKGVTSVQQRVLNLKTKFPEINHNTLCDAIKQRFFHTYSDTASVETLNIDSVKAIPELMQYYKTLKDWNWRFGRNPDFSHHLETRFDWGTMDVHVQVKKSVITDAAVYSDSLRPHMPSALASALKNVTYDRAGIDLAVHRCAARILIAQQHADAGEFTLSEQELDEQMQRHSLDNIDTTTLDSLHADDRNALLDVKRWLKKAL